MHVWIKSVKRHTCLDVKPGKPLERVLHQLNDIKRYWSADVLSGRHIVRCFLDILSGPSSDILSGLLGSAPDVLSGRLRIRHIVRRTFCQDWMDLHQTNCQDVYVDQSIFLVYWPYFWYVYDQISQFRPNFTISTKFHNFDQNGPK